MFGPDAIFLLAQIFVFFAVILIFFGAREVFSQSKGVGRRLDGKSNVAEQAAQHGRFSLALDDSRLKEYDKYLTPTDQEKLTKLREKLIRAGYRQPSDVRVYMAVRIVAAAIALFLGVIVFPLIMQNSPFYLIVFVMMLTLLLGFFGPKLWLDRNFQYRTLAAEEGFPDALDLILVCIEAGHGFDQALNRVVREMKTTNPILAEEFQVVVRELQVGKERYEVLNDFAWRTGVDDIASFINVIKQADKFGVSIAEALRVYSAEMREKRYYKAEEKANLMPAKLALGAIMFTVPPAILVMAGPSVILVFWHLTGVAQ